MSDDESGSDTGDGSGVLAPQVDERGFPIGSGQGGGPRVIATANPLQLKMEALKREAEAAAKVAAKKAALASRLAAFQGGKNSATIGGDSASAGDSSSGSAPVVSQQLSATPAEPPETLRKVVEKVLLDSRVVGMMKSAFTGKMTTLQGA